MTWTKNLHVALEFSQLSWYRYLEDLEAVESQHLVSSLNLRFVGSCSRTSIFDMGILRQVSMGIQSGLMDWQSQATSCSAVCLHGCWPVSRGGVNPSLYRCFQVLAGGIRNSLVPLRSRSLFYSKNTTGCSCCLDMLKLNVLLSSTFQSLWKPGPKMS